MKKIISYILACCICFTTFTMGVSAESTDFNEDGTLESIIETYDDAFIYYTNEYGSGELSRQALVITPDGDSYFYYDEEPQIKVKAKEGKTLPIDEINNKIEQYESVLVGPYSETDSTGNDYVYNLSFKNGSQNEVYEILKKYDMVESITEHKAVRRLVGGYSWLCFGVYINSKNVVSDEDIINKYPGLSLTADRQGFDREGYTYFSFKSNISQSTLLSKSYSDLKKLFNDYSDTILPLSVIALETPEYSARDTVIYKAEDKESDIQTGDINAQTGDTLKGVVQTFGDDTFTYYVTGNKEALVITPDGKSEYFYQMPTMAKVKVADGETLPVDEISDKIRQYTSNKKFDDRAIYQSSDNSSEYYLYPNEESRAEVYNILNKYSAVVSISECRKVAKARRNSWMCLGVYINNKNVVSDEEIINKYPELGLTAQRQGFDREGYTYFSFESNIGRPTVSNEIYSGLKKLFNDYSDCILPLGVQSILPMNYFEANTVVYRDFYTPRNGLETFNMKGNTNAYYKSGTLDDFIKKYGEDVFVNYFDMYGYNKGALVITPDGESELLYEELAQTTVNVKDGETLPIDEINAQIKQYTGTVGGFGQGINKSADGSNQYVLYPNDEYRTVIYNLLKKYDCVESISEYRKIKKAKNNSWTSLGVYINNNNNLSDEDIISGYPELGLTKDTEFYQMENYTYYSFPKSVGGQTVDNEIYSGLKRLFNDHSDSVLHMETLALALMDYSEVNKVVYNYGDPENTEVDIISDVTGDLDGNGTIDLSDLTCLSMHLIGDKELPETQLKAADCNGDGDVDIADLATLKQYVMGEKDVFKK